MRVELSKIRYNGEFQELCSKLLVAMHPDAKALRGSDEGLDTFIGDFNGILKCWQFKYFPKGIGNGQKSQIKKSIARAIKQHQVTEWTLCIPCQLSKDEHKWFQNLKKVYPNTKLDYWNKDKLETLIQKYKEVRDNFFEESEIVKKVRYEFAKLSTVNENFIPKLRGKQLSIFKIKIIGMMVKELIKLFQGSFPNDNKIGFTKFREHSNLIKTKFIKRIGTHYLNVYLEDSDNPFKLVYPKISPIEIWLKEEIKNSIPQITLTFFTSNYSQEQFFINLLKEKLPQEFILQKIDFNKQMKDLVTNKFPHAIDTMALDPSIAEIIRNEILNQNTNIQINDHIVHSIGGGLPKTVYMKKALSLVKRVSKNNKESDITFFRAKQTTNAIKNKTVTLEVHNKGNIRLFFKPEEEYEEMKIALNNLFDEIVNKL